MTHNFRAVLFDLGDTLIDFAPMDVHAAFRQGAQNTYDFLLAKGCRLPKFEKYCRAQVRAVRWSYFWSKVTGREFNSLTLLRRLAKQLHLQDNERVLTKLAWMWYEPVTTHAAVEPTALATLEQLRSRGVKLGIVSNTFVPGEVMDRHLRAAGLFDFFPARIYSSEIGRRKPDARIFHAALTELGALAHETLFVGDVVKTDIVGAKRCGMQTALRRPSGATSRHSPADYVIEKIADLMNLPGIPAGQNKIAANPA